METRAHYLLVGSFVLITLILLLGTIAWLAGTGDKRQYTKYMIYFTESVSGLTEGASVRFRGVEVGKVSSLRLDPVNAERVNVVVKIGAEVPVRQDTEATLKFQGLTGLAYIELMGGSPDSPLLETEGDDAFPVIPAARSAFDAIVTSAPDMITSFTDVATRASLLLSDDNIASFTTTLDNSRRFSQALADQEQQIAELVTDTRQAMQSLGAASNKINGIATRTESDLVRMIEEMRKASAELNRLTGHLEQLVSANRKQLDAFVGQGLPEATRTLKETGSTAREVRALSKSIKDQPSKVFFSPQREEYKVEP